MPVDLAVWPADTAAEPVDLTTTPRAANVSSSPGLDERAAETPPLLGEPVVIVRRRSAHEALLEAERRGAPDHEIRLREEAAIAASIARVRRLMRDGVVLTSGQRAQFERDRELLRRFPDDRRGVAGEGWVHLTR